MTVCYEHQSAFSLQVAAITVLLWGICSIQACSHQDTFLCGNCRGWKLPLHSTPFTGSSTGANYTTYFRGKLKHHHFKLQLFMSALILIWQRQHPVPFSPSCKMTHTSIRWKTTNNNTQSLWKENKPIHSSWIKKTQHRKNQIIQQPFFIPNLRLAGWVIYLLFVCLCLSQFQMQM